MRVYLWFMQRRQQELSMSHESLLDTGDFATGTCSKEEKFEYRNPKSETISKSGSSKFKTTAHVSIGEVLVIRILVIRIFFEFRDSGFEFPVTPKWVKCFK